MSGEEYQDLFRNVVMNTKEAHQMPIFTLFPPANIEAVDNDHGYSKISLKDAFLDSNRLLEIKESERQVIFL